MACLARGRHTLLLVLMLVFLPIFTLVFLAEPDFSTEEKLASEVAELKLKIQHLNSLHTQRLKEVKSIANLCSNIKNGDFSRNDFENFLKDSAALATPSIYNFLPHLTYNPLNLVPAYQKSQGRNAVSMVLGVPTVKRAAQNYLLTTLQSLIENMSPEEQAQTLIIVFVAETDLEYVESVEKQIETQFPSHLESGLIEIISPPASYYPDFSKITPTLGDPPDRFKWRTKQNLDFAFLMMYAQPKGLFYTQLEDDVLAKPQFVTTMLEYAYKMTSKGPWFVIEFSQLGFIGKMFKSDELPLLTQFLIMFHEDKPVDWLLDHLVTSKICIPHTKQRDCTTAKRSIWIQHKPSLFQHIGVHSSLNGKLQKLKDRYYGKTKASHPTHKNPKPVSFEGGVVAAKKHTMSKAYEGTDFFWGLTPKAGDHFSFKYDPPVSISRYLFRSGNAEYPSDIFYNTTVEVLPAEKPSSKTIVSPDGFVIVGKFNLVGLAEGSVNPEFSPVKEIRLNVHSDSKNWVILSEISIQSG